MPKSNQRKLVADHTGNHNSGWEQNRWPPKPLINTNYIFSFGAGSSKNDTSRLLMGDIVEGEYNPSGEINNCRNPKGPDGDYGVVQRRRDGGMEEHLPFNRGQCSLGLPSSNG